jgi:hypothetical protein
VSRQLSGFDKSALIHLHFWFHDLSRCTLRVVASKCGQQHECQCHLAEGHNFNPIISVYTEINSKKALYKEGGLKISTTVRYDDHAATAIVDEEFEEPQVR